MHALAQVRQLGYALDDQENEDGARCVGAPIFEYPGRVTAAISVSAPASRLGHEQVGDVAAAVMEAAALISRQLGHVGSSVSALPSTSLPSASLPSPVPLSTPKRRLWRCLASCPFPEGWLVLGD